MAEGIKKLWEIFNGIYSAIKKKELLPLATTWMDREGSMLREVSHTEKYKYCTISLTLGFWKKNKLIDTANRLVAARGRGERNR